MLRGTVKWCCATACWSLLLALPLGCAVSPPVSVTIDAPAPSPESGAPLPVMVPKSATTPLRVTYAGPVLFSPGIERVISVTIKNEGPTPETLNLFVLAIPQLALEVRDARDRVVPPMSPPVPPPRIDTAALLPSYARTFNMSLDAFSPPLPKGHYNVRLRDTRAYGLPFTFTVE